MFCIAFSSLRFEKAIQNIPPKDGGGKNHPVGG